MTNIETTVETTKRARIDWRDLLANVVRDNPDGTDAVHKQEFKKLIIMKRNKVFLDDLLTRVLSLEYNNTIRSVFPPTMENLKNIAETAIANRRIKEREKAAAIKKAEERTAKRLYSVVRAKTFGECAKIGNNLAKIATLGKPHQIVGDVIDEAKFLKLIK